MVEEDAVERTAQAWLDASVARRRGSFTLSADIWAHYTANCKAPQLDGTALGSFLRKRGFTAVKKGGTMRYEGIVLLPIGKPPLRLAADNTKARHQMAARNNASAVAAVGVGAPGAGRARGSPGAPRHGLVAPPGRPRRRATGTPLSRGSTPNELWCTDFKGEFKLGNGRYCYPLTVTDHASRYLLLCEALESTRENLAITAFERLFRERGLPEAIRSDNGLPFASPNALFNLSKLAVWWLRLGIDIERIKPGRPQQNGRHERMHLTLKKETVRPPGANSLQQQARFDEFVREFNTERPHEALEMKCPADVYTPARKPYSGLPHLTYPFHDRDVLVTACGRICIYRKKINLSIVLAGQRVGIKEVDDGIWIVSFMRYDLGYNLEARTLQPLDNPFGPRLSPMS